jgi:hypothetical protein
LGSALKDGRRQEEALSRRISRHDYPVHFCCELADPMADLRKASAYFAQAELDRRFKP